MHLRGGPDIPVVAVKRNGEERERENENERRGFGGVVGGGTLGRDL